MAPISRLMFVFALIGSMVCTSLEAQTGSTSMGCAVPKRPVHIYYSDPINGSMNGDGSLARPWGALANVIAAHLINGQDKTTGVVHAGDLIYLFSGDHGSIYLDQWHGKVVNTDFITIQAAPGQVPVLDQLMVDGASKWVFRGLTISQTASAPSSNLILTRFSSSNNILFDRNTICSQADVSQWGPSDWAASAAYYGLYFDGTSSTITNNKVKNVENGIGFNGSSNILKSNVIDCFANDGVDFTVSNSLIQYNSVTNHYGQWNDGAHHDGFQGWTVGGAINSNVVIDSNIVMASTGIYPAIPPQPTGVGDDYLQGLTIFDGEWTNLTVTNNVVAAAAWHGLSMYGISNSVIANNTVVNQSSDPELSAWIGVFSQSGQTMTNVIVRNNIANNFEVFQPGVVVDDHNLSLTAANANSWSNVPSNIAVSDPTTVFVTYVPSSATYNFNLNHGSPAIGAGSASSSPIVDIVNHLRNLSYFDIGAYAAVAN